MNLIQPAKQPARWLAFSDGAVVLDGVTMVGEATASFDLVAAEGEEAFLAAVSAISTIYKSLPTLGQWCEADAIYSIGTGFVVCRQSHYRTGDALADVPAIWSVYRGDASAVLDWVANERVYVGTRRAYGGKTYEAIQGHTTQIDWTPDRTPALWKLYVETPPTGEWAIGVAYKVGDIVTYGGKTYKCLQAHSSISTWHPDIVPALWQVI